MSSSPTPRTSSSTSSGNHRYCQPRSPAANWLSMRTIFSGLLARLVPTLRQDASGFGRQFQARGKGFRGAVQGSRVGLNAQQTVQVIRQGRAETAGQGLARQPQQVAQLAKTHPFHGSDLCRVEMQALQRQRPELPAYGDPFLEVHGFGSSQSDRDARLKQMMEEVLLMVLRISTVGCSTPKAFPTRTICLQLKAPRAAGSLISTAANSEQNTKLVPRRLLKGLSHNMHLPLNLAQRPTT